jgi:DNA-binding transcriptional MerR regulator
VAETDNQYTIAQLSQLCGISAHTLRYYERAGLLRQVGRTEYGYRVYGDRDLAWVQLLTRLRRTGMPIRKLKKLADLRSEGKNSRRERLVMLEQHRGEMLSQIEELQASLRYIDRAIEHNRALEQSGSSSFEDEAMIAYYAQRADHYERIYHRSDPVRQAELHALELKLCGALAGKRVLELACGTGYWTERVAQAVAHITAVDAAPETLAIAASKPLPPGAVTFREGDAYELDEVPGTFDAVLAMFWLSHVPKARLDPFLSSLHKRLGSGALVIFGDNRHVPGIGGELVARSGEPDTYKLRELSDGTKYEVLKNYFTEKELRTTLKPYAEDGTLQVELGECYWTAAYITK